ncbi:MAG: hypothetical protein KF744_13995 [Taibaiella sp.]|nr:hypothetical protein [Taibaiella sp.]
MRQYISRYAPFLVSALLLCALVLIAFPHYRYYVDPDGTSYLTISSRYANGDFSRAVNGLWSPWACWLTASLIRLGFAPVPAGCIINTIGAVGFLFGSGLLLARFSANRQQQWLFMPTIALFLVFAVYWQSFDDLWQCFFLSLILALMLRPGYERHAGHWLLAGTLGGLAYFAKAYSFQFLLLFFFVSSWLLGDRARGRWLVRFSVSAIVMAIVAFPWIYALHEKYHIWTTSTAGALNMSWYLVGHPTWNDSIDILLPPVYDNSVYNWEDPWFASGHLSGFLDSSHLFLRQILRIGYTSLMYLWCLAEMSIIFPLLAGYVVVRLLFQKRFGPLSVQEQLGYLFVSLLPVGYLLVHIESRYLWSALPIYIIALLPLTERTKRARLFQILLSLSLLVFPAMQMFKLYDEGRNEYLFANRLIQAGISNSSIVSDLHPRYLSKICYFSSNQFFVVSLQSTDGVKAADSVRAQNTKRLLADAQNRHVTYYLQGRGKRKNPGFDELFFENVSEVAHDVTFEKVLEDAGTGYVLYRLPGK